MTVNQDMLCTIDCEDIFYTCYADDSIQDSIKGAAGVAANTVSVHIKQISFSRVPLAMLIS